MDPQADEAEPRIVLRQIRMEDFEAIREMALRSFPGMPPWQREQIQSQLAIFPEGQLCIELDGEIVASSSNLIVNFDDYDEWQNWKDIADSGYIRNHNPAGDTL